MTNPDKLWLSFSDSGHIRYWTQDETNLAATLRARTDMQVTEYRAVKDSLTVESCATCANRGQINGSSQESFCDSCVRQESWRKNHYVAISTTTPELNQANSEDLQR